MGIVFAAHQIRLDRVVAIKILRPELATAVAAERFLDEGRILARLDHPAIVRVYDAGEADGLFYYVMEFVDGETLADRLQRGPLSAAEGRVLVHDLFGALSAAHSHGVVHRDVKPANIFLRNGRALLGDFGIARWRATSDPRLTATGQFLGTPQYMAPEQLEGLPSTERTDVYTAALVIWEAYTGKRWLVYQAPEQADWNRLPSEMAGPLRRALAPVPENRFANAGELLAALPTGVASPWRRPLLVGGLLSIAAGVIAVLIWAPLAPEPVPVGLTVEVERFEVRGAAESVRDSLTLAVVNALSGYPDLRVLPAGSRPGTPRAVRLSGVMTVAESGLRLELRATGGEAGGVVDARAEVPSREGWSALVRQVADAFLADVWRGTLAGDEWLPLRALPRSGDGLSRWHAAERLYAEAKWDEARDAYARIEDADSTCLLCTYRLIDIDRWLSTEPDSQRFPRLNRHLGSFPPHYQAIIRAQQQPWPARYDSLLAAARRYQGFFLASFLLGDELFHRGPLHGHLRHEALEPLQHALDLRPDFAPGWEHLGWVLLSEGSAAETRRALDRVPPDSATGLSRVLRTMLQLGYLWRFGSVVEAGAATGAVLSMPGVSNDYRTASGGRMLMTADAPAGAVGLGAQLATWRGKPEAVRGGLLAQAHGFAALGQVDSLRAVGLRLRQSASHALALYALELESVLTLAEPDDSEPADSGLLDALETFASAGAQPELRQRAAWVLALLSIRGGDFAGAAKARALLVGHPFQTTLGEEVDISATLRRGDTARAGRMLARLPRSDLSRSSPVPLEDAVRRLLRAAWLEQTESTGKAELELRWHEHLQLDGFPTGEPQSGEAAWALGTALRWRRARMLDQGRPADPELCAAYLAVARLWSGAEPRFAERARTAGRRASELKCEAAA